MHSCPAANIAAAKTVGEDCLQSAAVSTQWTTPVATRHKSCTITLHLKRPSSARCCLLVYLKVFKLREAPLPTLLFYSNTHHFLFFHTGEGLLMPLIQQMLLQSSEAFVFGSRDLFFQRKVPQACVNSV